MSTRYAAHTADPLKDAILGAITDPGVEDPMRLYRAAASDAAAQVRQVLADRDGLHIPTALTLLGALAGRACSMLAIHRARKLGDVEEDALTVLQYGDGHRYLSGALIDRPLMTDQTSVWALIGDKAEEMGATALPDRAGLLEHVQSTFGTSHFGASRLTHPHAPKDSPIHMSRYLWPAFLPTLTAYDSDPAAIHVSLSMATYEFIEDAAGEIAPMTAAGIVMEAAVPVSRVHPGDYLN